MAKTVNFETSLNSPVGGTSSDSYLAKITTAMPSLSWTTIGIIIAVIILVVVGYYVYKQQIVSLTNPTFNANSEHKSSSSNGGTSSGEAELMLFYVDWCPHCKTAKPEWEKVKTEYDGKVINGHTVHFSEINCTEESPEVEKMMNTYKIEGYPTIKMLKDGQIIEFDAKPTSESLTKFIETVV
jgi:thiol-disulfide isomerase/thioredoxin